MTMSKTLKRRRVIYLGMINTSRYASRVGENLYVAAGTEKMLSVTLALRSVGVRAGIITLPVLGKDSKIKYRASVLTADHGVPVISLCTWRNRWLRKILGSISFAFAAMRVIKHSDRVIIYNHGMEYIPALIVLRLRKIKIFHDIEDYPLSRDFTLNGFVNSIGFMFADLFATKKILVSQTLASRLELKEYLVIQGVNKAYCNFQSNKWVNLDADDSAPLYVHYGGTLIHETGIDLFCTSVEILLKAYRGYPRPVVFVVTGYGGIEKIKWLERRARHSELITVRPLLNLPYDEYIKILKQCHLSLSLKLPDCEISETTFPSKVLEIASFNIALVSTRASDIPYIFNEKTAFLLPDSHPTSLVNTVSYCAQNPSEVFKVASAGRHLVENRFSALSIGHVLSRFLE